ncbi:hypothetical protein [Aquabacterium sp.]|uniref:hypothetical protein n=1 Tax=Aquabacterium sp. TaxID=1872578 RepID=UPI002B541E42|nr:hypothetical protein [Aquabacterium sp.]HSW08301.1 hypothetical protein [Aquabacterium sp.]
MLVFSHTHLPRELLDGVQRCCIAGAAQGLHCFEAWHYGIEPGAEAALAACADETVLLVLEGAGRLALASGPQRVQAPCTVRLPPQDETRVANIGAAPLKLLLLSASPAAGPSA